MQRNEACCKPRDVSVVGQRRRRPFSPMRVERRQARAQLRQPTPSRRRERHRRVRRDELRRRSAERVSFDGRHALVLGLRAVLLRSRNGEAPGPADGGSSVLRRIQFCQRPLDRGRRPRQGPQHHGARGGYDRRAHTNRSREDRREDARDRGTDRDDAGPEGRRRGPQGLLTFSSRASAWRRRPWRARTCRT